MKKKKKKKKKDSHEEIFVVVGVVVLPQNVFEELPHVWEVGLHARRGVENHNKQSHRRSSCCRRRQWRSVQSRFEHRHVCGFEGVRDIGMVATVLNVVALMNSELYPLLGNHSRKRLTCSSSSSSRYSATSATDLRMKRLKIRWLQRLFGLLR